MLQRGIMPVRLAILTVGILLGATGAGAQSAGLALRISPTTSLPQSDSCIRTAPSTPSWNGSRSY